MVQEEHMFYPNINIPLTPGELEICSAQYEYWEIYTALDRALAFLSSVKTVHGHGGVNYCV